MTGTYQVDKRLRTMFHAVCSAQQRCIWRYLVRDVTRSGEPLRGPGVHEMASGDADEKLTEARPRLKWRDFRVGYHGLRTRSLFDGSFFQPRP